MMLNLIKKYPRGLTKREILDKFPISILEFKNIILRIENKLKIIKFGNARLFKWQN